MRLSIPVVLLCSLVIAPALGGCGGSAFSAAFPENQDPEITLVLRALASPPPREERPVIVGARPGGIFAWDLAASQMLFSIDTEARSAPLVAGNVVVTQEADGIVGRDLASGEHLFTLDDDWTLVGADGDGDRTVISASWGPQASPHGVVVLARNGSVEWSHELQMPAGTAAVSGDIVIVPWATQRISFLDATTGAERARMRMEDCVVGHALVAKGGVFAGQHGLVRLQPGAEAGVRSRVAWWEPLGRPLPGQPPLLLDGYAPAPAPDAAQWRVRQLFRPVVENDTVTLDGDAIYLQFYKLLFALAPNENEVKWVYRSDADLVGAAASEGGIVAVGRDGKAIFVEPEQGRRTWEVSLGVDVLAASVRPGAWAPETSGELPEPEPLAEQLFAAASLHDPRLGGGRALAVTYLARFPDEEVTGQLVDLCSETDAPEPLRIAACTAVGERTTGLSFVRDALERRASFLAGTSAPPVGALAKAAAAMHARATVPALVRHLEDPLTPSVELPGLLEGLGGLGDRASATAIERFLSLYHAEDGDPHMTEALVAAEHALAAVRRRDAVPLLTHIADDTLATAPVREGARAAIAWLDAPPPADETAPPAEPVPPPEETVDTRPTRITPAITEQVFRPALHQLQTCLTDEARTARVAMVVDPSGTIRAVVIGPDAVSACMEPHVRALTFPATRMTASESVTYVVRR